MRGDVYTNTVECFFSLLKRGIHGTFHHVSEGHLNRYCDEFSFRWNHRKATDAERAMAALAGVEGKRLTYKAPMGVNPALSAALRAVDPMPTLILLSRP